MPQNQESAPVTQLAERVSKKARSASSPEEEEAAQSLLTLLQFSQSSLDSGGQPRIPTEALVLSQQGRTELKIPIKKRNRSLEAVREKREAIEDAIKKFVEHAQCNGAKKALRGLSKKISPRVPKKTKEEIKKIIKFIAIALHKIQTEKRELSTLEIFNIRQSQGLREDLFLLYYYILVATPFAPSFIELCEKSVVTTVAHSAGKIKSQKRLDGILQNKIMMLKIVEKLMAMDIGQITKTTINEFAEKIEGKGNARDKRRKIRFLFSNIEQILSSISSNVVTEEDVQRILKDVDKSSRYICPSHIVIVIKVFDLLNPIKKQAFIDRYRDIAFYKTNPWAQKDQ